MRNFSDFLARRRKKDTIFNLKIYNRQILKVIRYFFHKHIFVFNEVYVCELKISNGLNQDTYELMFMFKFVIIKGISCKT